MRKQNLSFLLVLTVLVMTLCSTPGVVNAGFDAKTVNFQLDTTEQPKHMTLTWTADPKTTQTITWWTSTAVNNGMVQYREVKERESKTKSQDAGTATKFVTAVERGDEPGEMNIHTATLTGLKPGKTYTYRVGDGKNWSEYSTFTTENPKDESFKMLMFPDAQDTHAKMQVWNDVLHSAYEANKDAKFVTNLGDMSHQGQAFNYFNNWFDASKEINKKLTLMPIMGNHEGRDAKTGNYGLTPYYLELFTLPTNGPEGYKEKAYTYDYGNAHFVVLDSQMYEQYKTAEERDKAIQAQIEWLDKDLATTVKPWKIVMYHRSQYYMKTNRVSTHMKAFEPTFAKYHVDVVFNGHDHAVSRTYPINNGEFMSKASEGTVYYVTGRSNMNVQTDVNAKVWQAFNFDPQNLPVYQTVEVSKSKLTVKTFEQDGRLIDNFIIDKANPANTTLMVPSGKLPTAALVLYGNKITYGEQPKFEKGDWYVDFNLVALVSDSKYDKVKSTLTFRRYKQTVTLTDDMFRDASRKMISLEALRSIGFECIYQEKTNFIMVERINNGNG